MTTAASITDGPLIGEASLQTQRARAEVDRRAELWAQRPLVREIYEGYQTMIRAARSTVAGCDVEVGAGHGGSRQPRRGVFTCDIIPCPWLDVAADACRLPFGDEQLANIIMLDVLHHLEDPMQFFEEADRTLAPGGRIVMLEPYVSPMSWPAWRYMHHENIDMSARPTTNRPTAKTETRKDPWDANTAIPTLLFWREINSFHERLKNLKVIRREQLDLLLYPLSGGFGRRRLLPHALAPAIRSFERLLKPLAPLLAFRCLVVVEKRSG